MGGKKTSWDSSLLAQDNPKHWHLKTFPRIRVVVVEELLTCGLHTLELLSSGAVCCGTIQNYSKIKV